MYFLADAADPISVFAQPLIADRLLSVTALVDHEVKLGVIFSPETSQGVTSPDPVAVKHQPMLVHLVLLLQCNLPRASQTAHQTEAHLYRQGTDAQPQDYRANQSI